MNIEKLAELEKSFIDFCKSKDCSYWSCYTSNAKVLKEDVFELTIEISWGDWKHDHLASGYCVEEWCKENNFFISGTNEELTEEDGSDSYSAIHKYYIFLDKELGASMKKMLQPEGE